MSQTKKQSFAESCTSTAIGFSLSFILGLIIYPNLSQPVTPWMTFLVTIAFTILSLFRGYLIRRLFNWWHHRNFS